MRFTASSLIKMPMNKIALWIMFVQTIGQSKQLSLPVMKNLQTINIPKIFFPFLPFWIFFGFEGKPMYYKYKGISWIDKSHCRRRHVSSIWVTGRFLDLLIRLVLLRIMIIFTGISMILVVLNSGIIISMREKNKLLQHHHVTRCRILPSI